MTHRVLMVALLICGSGVKTDDYLQESQSYCEKDSGIVSCGKLRMLRYISELAKPADGNATSSVRLVKLSGGVDSEQIFSSSRYFPGDSEFGKFTKYLKRKIGDYIGQQGFAVTLPEEIKTLIGGTEVEGRVKGKKKVELLLTILILFKVFKVKVLVALALVALLFIKKTILLGALYLPTVLQSIKSSCKPNHPVYHHEDHHDLHESLTGYGKEYEAYYKS